MKSEQMAFELRGVGKTFHASTSWFGGKGGGENALDAIDFDIPAGSSFGIVGESGSGKSTLARILCGLSEPSRGSVRCLGREVGAWKREDPRGFRKAVQMVFQNPASSLNPRQRVRTILSHPLRILGGVRAKAEREKRLLDLMERVGLPANALDRFPHEFSGGQSQRVAIARALAASPSILLLDEATSALDVSVQAQILALLETLRREGDWTLVFIGHDLAVVRQICDRVAVLQGGKLMEEGPVERVLKEPDSDYTRTLLESSPTLVSPHISSSGGPSC